MTNFDTEIETYLFGCMLDELDDKLGDENTRNERKQRLELALEISRTFQRNRLPKKIRQHLVRKMTDLIESDLSDYEIVSEDGYEEGRKWKQLCIYKTSWRRDKNMPDLYYAISFDQNDLILPYYGIAKGNKRRDKDIPCDQNTIFHRSLEGFKASDDWLAWKYLEDDLRNRGAMWQDKFFLDIADRGFEEIADEFCQPIVKLIKETEEELGIYLAPTE